MHRGIRKDSKMRNSMRFSSKKLVALLLIMAICTVGVVFAAIRFTNSALSDSPVVQTDETLAEKVTVYGNGVTFVEYQEAITIENGSNAVQFYLPSGALTDTLTVTGIDVATIATNEESQPIIASGDLITVYTNDGSSYTGNFISWDTMLLLEAGNGTIMIPETSITRIVLNQVVQVQGPQILVEVTTNSPPGDYELNVSYLMRGPQWTPTYFIDLDTSYLQCWATIENVESWSNFTLVLVSGGPHIVYNGPVLQSLSVVDPLVAADYSVSVDFTPSTTDEYHEYTYSPLLSFQEGTTVKVPLFNGTVSLRQEYFWNGGDVENRYHINDTLDQPLAAGTVEFYRGTTWVGEDSIGYTPVNAESIAIVNYAYDIQVTSTVTKLIEQNNYEDQGTNITIQNYEPTNIQILIQQDTYGYDLVSTNPQATIVGSTLSWIINVNVNSTATIYYEWQNSW